MSGALCPVGDTQSGSVFALSLLQRAPCYLNIGVAGWVCGGLCFATWSWEQRCRVVVVVPCGLSRSSTAPFSSPTLPFLSRAHSHSRYLYQIVSNSCFSVDVDKFDYLARDCFYLGYHPCTRNPIPSPCRHLQLDNRTCIACISKVSFRQTHFCDCDVTCTSDALTYPTGVKNSYDSSRLLNFSKVLLHISSLPRSPHDLFSC